MRRAQQHMCARRVIGGIGLVTLALACAEGAAAGDTRTTPERPARARSEVAVAQAELEAARRHPIAQPEPRTAYPEQQPPARAERGLPEQAPPPRETTAPEQAPPPREATSSPAAQLERAETRVVAPQAPPEPYFEQAPLRPAPEYVWAPGYWYWYSGDYVWVPGAWLPPRHGHVFVSARWVYTSDGWVFVPGGWAIAGGSVVVVPLYRHRYLYPHRPYSRWHRSHDHHGHGDAQHHRAPHYDRSRPSNRTSVRPSSGDRSRHDASDRSWNRTSVRPDGGGERSYGRTAVRPQSLSRGNRLPRSVAVPAPRRGDDRGRR